MSTVIVKRFVQKFAEGGLSHYSIRRRPDGLFQVYHMISIRASASPTTWSMKRSPDYLQTSQLQKPNSSRCDLISSQNLDVGGPWSCQAWLPHGSGSVNTASG